MPDDLTKQPFWKNLPFTLKTLTHEVFNEKAIRIKNKEAKANRARLSAIAILATIIIGIFRFQAIQKEPFKMLLLFLELVGMAYLVIFFTSKKFKDSYDKKRLRLIALLDSSFCTCSSSCTCKESYIEYMFKNGINLTDE